MKKILISCILLISFQVFSQEDSSYELGVACINPDSRCSGYDIDVNASVLSTVQFYQLQPLNLGKVTKGETVIVDASINQTRDRKMGILEVWFDSSVDAIQIECVKDQSIVNFGTEDSTKFSQCYMDAYFSGAQHSSFNFSGDTPIYFEPRNDSYYIVIYLGATIQVPLDATIGEKVGSIRVEFTYL